EVSTCGCLAPAVRSGGQDDSVDRELTLRGSIVDREWHNPPVGEPDTPRLALRAGRLLQHDGRRPVHVIKRQPCSRERPLPSRLFVARSLAGFDALDGLRYIRLRAAELNAPRAALVARQPLLQSLLHRPLQWRADRRAHCVRVGGDRLDTCNRLRFPGDLIDEVEADGPARPFIGYECWQ